MAPSKRLKLGVVLTALAGSAHASHKSGKEKNGSSVDVPHLTWLGIADWGGQQLPPYTTPGQVLNAQAMNLIAGKHRPSFVVSAGVSSEVSSEASLPVLATQHITYLHDSVLRG